MEARSWVAAMNLNFSSFHLSRPPVPVARLLNPSFRPEKLGFRSNSRSSEASSSRQVTCVSKDNAENVNAVSVKPVYVPTPSNRELRTPHSGYHFDGTTRKFFEGWYFKVSIPERKQSFCFMYSVENPAFPKKLSPLDMALYGPRFTGVGAQILGAYDKYICQYTQESQNFWGDRHELVLGNTFAAVEGARPPSKEVPPEEFNKRVSEGFQVTPLWHQGYICDDGRTNYLETVKSARWEYSTRPVYGWGNVGSKQKSTAGWLAAFPVFEPHWQICMAGGLSTGWIEWDGERFEFEDAPSYSEKNWGGGFPRKWFWVQCNVFEGADGEVAFTAAGGLRQLPGLTETFENAALIGVHYDGIFYEFVPWNGVLKWEMTPWGYWYMTAENETHVVEVEARTNEAGTPLRAPTMESGLAPACRDSCYGELRLQLWERRYDGSKGKGGGAGRVSEFSGVLDLGLASARASSIGHVRAQVTTDIGDIGREELDGGGGDRRRALVQFLERRDRQHSALPQKRSPVSPRPRLRFRFGSSAQTTWSLTL
ncbi:PREDICTED: tocopherol cyclase, chloroplastic isoform X1 [Tarenaya hassleriana]|uniref:tocopherol cyclase, chloroplastic isoform X1 n=1 Tax=Tarenaya hassleriana TaxID=28532 RepID=UPI00053C92C1|nr:PREDICTED: tocopherol cyclase, chloroplastic isoform X1 [Tarenaya hassleriana]